MGWEKVKEANKARGVVICNGQLFRGRQELMRPGTVLCLQLPGSSFGADQGGTWTGRTLNIKAVELVLMFKVPCTFCSAFKRLENFQAVVQSQTCLLRCKDGASTRGTTQAYPSANMGGQKGVPLRPSLSSHLRCIDSRILARLTVWTGHKEVYICLTQAYEVCGQGMEEDNPVFIFMTWLDSVLGGMRYQRCNRRRKRKQRTSVLRVCPAPGEDVRI